MAALNGVAPARWKSVAGLVAALTIAALAPAAMAGQQSGRTRAAPAPQTSIVKNVNEVNLVFSAVDKHHRIITGLRPDEIEVLDRNQPQRITHFYTEGDMPLRIALLIDTSSSVRDRFKFEQEAAIEFIESVLKQGRDQAMVVAFDSSIQVVQDFTDNEEALANAIHQLRAAGGTALYDAVYSAAHDKMMHDGENVRNVMVVISDGADDQSRVAGSDALQMAQEADAIIYTIGTEPTGMDPQDDKIMRAFATETGGQSFFPFAAQDLGRAFYSIADELRHQYVVTYQPNNFTPNGSFHPIEVRILLKNITARARRGYYAIPHS